MQNKENTSYSELTIDRVSGFSDGVMAIVVTILVLGIDIPTDHNFSSEGLISFLYKLETSLLAYVISFILGFIYWVQHYFMFHYLKYTTHKLNWINGFFLLAVSLLPFVSKVKTMYEFDFSAVFIYSIVHLCISGMLLVLWRYITTHQELQGEQIPSRLLKNYPKVLWIIPIVCIAANGVSIIDVHIGTYMFFIIPLVNILFFRYSKYT